jgi:hypothetical protein
MRALRVVGITGEDGNISVVLEDPERRERFSVPGDETLRAAARGDLARLGQIAIEVGNQLRPREIQSRIRAGASVAELATLAGVPEQKIERFAYPVLLERSRTAELARLAHPVRRDGPDRRTLAEVVADTFELRGQTYEEAVWDSWKGEDGRWVVALAWTAGRSDNTAHWTFQPGASGGTVTAVDEHAGDLVEGLPARPLRTIGEVIDLARNEEDVATGAATAAPRRAEPHGEFAPSRIGHRRSEATQRRTEPESQRPEPRRGGTRAAEQPHRSPAEPTARRRDGHQAEEDRTTVHPAPRTEPQPQPQEHRPEPRHEDPPTEEDRPEPAPAAQSDEPTPAPASPSRRTKKGKPVMPSWDEVLLGVKGHR